MDDLLPDGQRWLMDDSAEWNCTNSDDYSVDNYGCPEIIVPTVPTLFPQYDSVGSDITWVVSPVERLTDVSEVRWQDIDTRINNNRVTETNVIYTQADAVTQTELTLEDVEVQTDREDSQSNATLRLLEQVYILLRVVVDVIGNYIASHQ